MHDNREPRFYASIGFNYCVWPGTSYTGTEAIKNFVANYYKDGNSQPTGNIKWIITELDILVENILIRKM